MQPRSFMLLIFGIGFMVCLWLFLSEPVGTQVVNAAQVECDETDFATQASGAEIIAVPADAPLICDAPITDTIESVGDSDLFSFTAADGDMVQIAVAEGQPAQSLFHAVWRLLKRTGEPADSCGEFSHLAIPARDCGPLAAADSPYRIEVADENNSQTGVYHLHYQLLSGPTCHARGLSCHTSTTGEIETPADSDLFTFTVASEGIVKITVVEQAPSQSLFHAVWRVLNSNGAPAASCGDFSHLAISARDCGPLSPSNSPYRVEVIDEDRAHTGHYTISLAYLDGSCPDETPTPTATPTGSAPTPTPAAMPVINAVRPNQGRNDLANTITIQGAHFAQAVSVSLGTAPLTTTFLATTQLQAIVPAGIAANVYDVNVTNPDGGRGELLRGYTAFDAVTNDDLLAFAYEFYLDPVAPRVNTPTNLILRIHRQGGKDPLLNVKVAFYLGDPQAGGVLIGQSAAPPLAPRSDDQSRPIVWTPTTTGDAALYAVIDPQNVIAETYEDNNTVLRIVTILPPAPDQAAPHVDSFTLNDGASSTSTQAIQLETQASDEPAPNPVAKLLFVEYAYSEAAGVWTPVQQSEWLDYAAAHEHYPWQLLPPGGVKALHAWAADAAGNISRFPFRRQINYLPPSERIEFNQRQIFRYTLNVGQALTAQLTALTGDPDLYVWPPDYATRPPWVSNLTSVVDDVAITAPISGVYQVEVYGFSAANYQLAVTIGSAVAAGALGGIDSTKGQLLSQPLLPPTAQPDGSFALLTPGPRGEFMFMPVISTEPAQR